MYTSGDISECQRATTRTISESKPPTLFLLPSTFLDFRRTAAYKPKWLGVYGKPVRIRHGPATVNAEERSKHATEATCLGKALWSGEA